MIHPKQILLFFISVFAVLGLFTLVFPKDGIVLSDDLSLEFITFEELIYGDTSKPIDISDIINLNIDELENDVDDSLLVESIDTLKVDSSKTIASVDTLIPFDINKIFAGVADTSNKRAIQYPNRNKSLFYPFYEALISNKKQVRLVHYGDSQLEGDRITGYLRNKLQNIFGGNGPGMLSIHPIVVSFGMGQERSESWLRYTAFGRRDTTIKHRKFGALCSFSRFAPPMPDSLLNDTIQYSGWVEYTSNKRSYKRNRNYKRIRLFYGNSRRPVKVIVKVNNLAFDSLVLPATQSLKTLQYSFDVTPDKIRFEFEGADSPDIYTVNFDDNSGIAVDNVAMRGSSGTIFTRTNAALFQQMHDSLNTKLVILEFGGNVIPYMKDSVGVRRYGRAFKRQIQIVKKLIPDVCILVIGLGDMSVKEKDQFVTYPFVEAVRDEMKKVSFASGAAFWDMFEVMGGKNSMPSWVAAEPSLGSKDYVHFTYLGAKKIGELFTQAFIQDYKEYKRKRSKVK